MCKKTIFLLPDIYLYLHIPSWVQFVPNATGQLIIALKNIKTILKKVKVATNKNIRYNIVFK